MDLTQLLEQRANDNPDQLGYRFLPNDREVLTLSYGQLVADAERLARIIRKSVPAGQRILLIYPAGLQFIQAFYACLLANVVAVPLPLPRPNDTTHRLDHVVKDCEPAAVFTEEAYLEQVRAQLPDAYRVVITATDGSFDMAHILCSPSSADRDVAMLQYTSGSTSKPKGVVLRQGNLLANLKQIQIRFGHTRESSGVIWLPHYHDMGLIGGILQPLFVGFPVTLFSPISFVQRPLRWLQAIHTYQATTSGGPNFAYDLCVAKADAAKELHLDLSRWSVAFNGAEPVKADTLDAFSQAFSATGFRRSAFVACYGLAEASLLVAAVSKESEPMVIESSDSRITAKGVAVPHRGRIVSCGTAADGMQVRILRIGADEVCSEGDIGEIVVYGHNVASGYWGKVDEAFIKDSLRGFRTGDLGFKIGEELFVTGRFSDLVVIRGKNLFPEDIEATIHQAEPALAREGVAAFSVDGNATEELVIVQEMSSRTLRAVNLVTTKDAVSDLVLQHHGIRVATFVAVKSGSLVRTSSGKISRFACKQLYVARKLQSLPVQATER